MFRRRGEVEEKRGEEKDKEEERDGWSPPRLHSPLLVSNNRGVGPGSET